jgi:2-hydroxychromene-2-carboxylate isomerase
MTDPLECYFDYRSPFPFLAIEPIAALALKHSVDVDWIPIRLPDLSSYRDRPMGHGFPKRNAYVARDLQRWAERRGVTVHVPNILVSESTTPPASVMGKDHPMDTDALLRGAVVARRLGLFDAYHRAAYQTLWGSGVDAPLEAALARGIEAIDQNPSSFRKSLESEEIGDELRSLTEAADERGVFGVPTFFVEDEMFWGQDRIDFVEEALSRA